jgi:hypothetical protein
MLQALEEQDDCVAWEVDPVRTAEVLEVRSTPLPRSNVRFWRAP